MNQQTLTIDESYNAYLNISLVCPDCHNLMELQTSNNMNIHQDSWNETENFCIVTIVCPCCNCSGSLNLNIMK